ncbi:MAG: DUF2723 domain-containing protein [Deltaproteobacteria bacterium]|nr:DUF2723 domain-containing protein [Deltaproteobacteria bacterium]
MLKTGLTDGKAALLSALAVFVGYLFFLPPVPYWLDAPEFMAAAWNLGQPHPPGHPVMTLLLKAFLLVPLGDAAFKANLFSAFFAAVSAGFLGLLSAHSVRALNGSTGRGILSIIACCTAAFGFGVSGSMVIQALSVEVYTFNSALVFGAVLLAVRHPSDWRVGALLGVALALGAANHHLLTVLAVPALFIAFFRNGALATAGLLVSVASFVIVTIGCYAMLWARDLAGAWPAWAETSSLGGLAWFASASLFAESVGGFDTPGSGMARNTLKALAMLADNLSPAGVAMALGGLYLLVRGRAVRLALVLLALVSFTLLSKVAMGILDPENPDDHGYFLVALGGVVVLGVTFGATLLRAASATTGLTAHLLRGTGVLFLVAMTTLPLTSGLPVARERAGFDDTRAIGRFVMEEQPAGGVVFLSHYPMLFLTQHLQWVEGCRPDLTVVQESLNRKARGGTRYAGFMARMDPDLQGVVDRFLGNGTLDWREIMGLSRKRAVRLEASPAWAGLVPVPTFSGWTLSAGDDNGPPKGDDETIHLARAWLERVRALVPAWPELETETRRVLMRNLASTASHLLAGGLPESAMVLVSAALELNPGDGILLKMADRGRTPRP